MSTPTTPPFTSVSAAFTYDGDGKMVKAVMDGVTTLYVSAMYQIKGSVVTKYYAAGGQVVAIRTGSTLSYLISDHIGSNSITVSDTGTKTAETRYKAWGEVRYQSGTNPSDRTYTGQRSYASDFGLMYYNARWYDSNIGRFAQADTDIPASQGGQGYDRYAYVNNSPINYTDPSGHNSCDAITDPVAKEHCRAASGAGLTDSNMADALKRVYGWDIQGDWSEDELNTMCEAAVAIESYVDSLTSGKGLEWMHRYMGNATFDHNGILPGFEYVEGSTIHLIGGTFNTSTVIHELGHVFDNNTFPGGNSVMTGGGAGDDLNQYIGGSIKDFHLTNGNRWWNPNIRDYIDPTIPKNQAFDKNVSYYANGCTADYFAETFKLNILNHANVPTRASQWMDGFIISFSIDSQSSIIK